MTEIRVMPICVSDQPSQPSTTKYDQIGGSTSAKNIRESRSAELCAARDTRNHSKYSAVQDRNEVQSVLLTVERTLETLYISTAARPQDTVRCANCSLPKSVAPRGVCNGVGSHGWDSCKTARTGNGQRNRNYRAMTRIKRQEGVAVGG